MSTPEELTQILLAVNSSSNEERNQAEAMLDQMRAANYPQFLYVLCERLCTPGVDTYLRQSAGTILKVNLDAKDANTRAELAHAWQSMDPTVKGNIKQGLVATLGSEDAVVGRTAAQVIGKIAAIEIPSNEWPELVDAMLYNITTGQELLKRATLDTLGYICEGVTREMVSGEQVNNILTAIVGGMSSEESDSVRLCATQALINALGFLSNTFQIPNDRNFLMQVVCETTQSNDPKVRRYAMECLVKILGNFYSVMGDYMDACYQLTFGAVRSDPEPSALQAVEFWSTMCEEEIFLNSVAEEAYRKGEEPPMHSGNYIVNNLAVLVDLLLETMCRQTEDHAESSWSIAMAAGTCLDLVARCAKDQIVEHVMPFVVNHAENTNWHFQEAAVFAFGSIMSGVSGDVIGEHIATGLGLFANLMAADNVVVAESAAWTVGRICKYHADQLNEGDMMPFLAALNEGLMRHPRIASNCCWSLTCLAESFNAMEEATYPISPVFGDFMMSLLQVTERPDALENHLVAEAYTCITRMIETAPADCIDPIFATFQVLVERLEASLAFKSMTADDVRTQSELQGNICAVLHVITQKAGPGIAQYADHLMNLYMAVFEVRTVTVIEEGLLAVGALADAIEEQFLTYVAAFMPVIYFALRNSAEHNVCIIAIGVIADICRAIEEHIIEYVDDIIALLVQIIQNPASHRDIHPSIMSCFGDIASALNHQFPPYLVGAMEILGEASTITVDTSYAANIFYINDLRLHVLEGYTGIVQALKSCKKTELLKDYVPHLFGFIEHIYLDEYRDEPVTRAAICLLGDIGHSLKKSVGQYLAAPHILPLLREIRDSADEESIDAYEFAMEIVRKYAVRG